MRVSVVVPSKDCEYVNYLLFSLKEQTLKPYEIVLVVRDCDYKTVENVCRGYGLRCIVIEQKRGFVTTALNMGKKVAKGDIILFTDDDVLAPKGWIKRYVKAFSIAPRDVGCISSRDVYIELSDLKVIPTKDDYFYVKIYRWFIRTWLEPPLDILREYRFGVYISRNLEIVHGPYLPERACLSLPYRGVNMGFRSETLEAAEFPEHPKLKRALGFEQYVGLRLVLNGWSCVYIPQNPTLHVFRKRSLSRGVDKTEKINEIRLMRSLLNKLIQENLEPS